MEKSKPGYPVVSFFEQNPYLSKAVDSANKLRAYSRAVKVTDHLFKVTLQVRQNGARCE